MMQNIYKPLSTGITCISRQEVSSPKFGIGNALNKILAKYSSCSFSGSEAKLHEKEKTLQDTKDNQNPLERRNNAYKLQYKKSPYHLASWEQNKVKIKNNNFKKVLVLNINSSFARLPNCLFEHIS